MNRKEDQGIVSEHAVGTCVLVCFNVTKTEKDKQYGLINKFH